MQAALGMMRKVHKASRIASYMGSMATVTQGAVTMVAIATTMLPGAETFACPQTMAYQESINVSNSFIEGRGVPEPRTVSDDKKRDNQKAHGGKRRAGRHAQDADGRATTHRKRNDRDRRSSGRTR